MNNAIRATVRVALHYGLEVYGVFDGYKGLVNKDFKKMDRSSVSDIVNRGGTILRSARLPEFKDPKVREIALNNLKEEGIDALIAIGGDGTYQGALELSRKGLMVATLPGTIDNDIPSTDYTIGFDTALNTIVDAIDKVRDTTESHSRCSIIEVMGNKCGDLALYSGVAEGAEIVITPEHRLSDEEVYASLNEMYKKDSNKRAIMVVCEKIYPDIHEFARKIEANTPFVTRANILGYVQRGGTPSPKDRSLAVRMGAYAIRELMDGKGCFAVGIRENKIVSTPIEEALKMTKKPQEDMLKLLEEND